MYSGYHGGDPESVKAVMDGHTNMMYIMAGAATLVLLMFLAYYFYNKNKKVDPTKKTTFTGHHSNWHHGSAHSGNGGHIDTVNLGSSLTGIPVALPPLKDGEKCPRGTYLTQEKIPLYDPTKTVYDSRSKRWTDVPIIDPATGKQAFKLGDYYCRPGGNKDPSYNTEFSKYLHHGTTLGKCTQENWDTDATTEAQALAQVGALQHDIYGEDLLQSAIDKTYSGLNTMSYVDSSGKINQNYKSIYKSNKKGQGYDDDTNYSDE
jgi:hypothetical protein